MASCLERDEGGRIAGQGGRGVAAGAGSVSVTPYLTVVDSPDPCIASQYAFMGLALPHVDFRKDTFVGS